MVLHVQSRVFEYLTDTSTHKIYMCDLVNCLYFPGKYADCIDAGVSYKGPIKKNLIGLELDDFVVLKCDFQAVTSNRYNCIVQKCSERLVKCTF